MRVIENTIEERELRHYRPDLPVCEAVKAIFGAKGFVMDPQGKLQGKVTLRSEPGPEIRVSITQVVNE